MRGISLTYGQTTIDGGFVRTGEISSIDGVTKFNLNTGTISGRIIFAAGSSGYANISDKPVLGSLSGLNIVELAQLGTTVITGGYLATSLIDANYIRTIDLIANKVTTGKLQSVNTLNYFDLDNNQFKLGNATNYMDWNVTTPNVLTIKGHITADSGTISGVTINANDQFSLNGSKVEIFPNAGMRVFGAGYADFTNATLKVPTVTPSGLASGEAALWIGSLSGVASGASGGSVATLSDVALTSLATGQILVWNGATWVNQNNVAAVDLSAYYTKTETQNFFSGASAMSGYNKSNWDSAYGWGNHAAAGYYSPSNQQVNISGNAGTASMLMAQGSSLTAQSGSGSVAYNYAVTHPQTGLFSAVDNSNSIITVNRHPGDYYSQIGFSSNGNLYYRCFSATPINTSLAWRTVLDSANYNSYSPTLTGGGASGTWGINISGNAANASVWAGWALDYSSEGSTLAYLFGGDGSVPTQRFYQASKVRAFLGLGSAAYQSWDNAPYGNTYYGAHSYGSFSEYTSRSHFITHYGYSSGSPAGGAYHNGFQSVNHDISYGFQFVNPISTNQYFARMRNGAGWNGWVQFITSDNIASQTVSYASSETLSTVTSRGNTTAYDITSSGLIAASNWFRAVAKTGLYNSTYAGHFYQSDTTTWSINGGGSAPFGLRFQSGHEGTTYGYVYADGVNFGLLYGGGWAVKTYSGGGELVGSWNATGTLKGASGVYTDSWFYANGNTGLYFNSYAYGLWAADSGGNAYGNVTTYGVGKNNWSGYGIGSTMRLMGRESTDMGLHNNSAGWVWYSTYAGQFTLGGSSPYGSYKFTVEGGGSSIYASGLIYSASYIQAAGAGYFGGDVIAYYSDARLKNIKGNITNALAMLHQVDGVYYEANDHALSIGAVKERKNEVGLIAQQWQSFMPEVLALAPFDMDGHGGSKSGLNYMTMKYERTVPLIIEAIKEVDNKYTREIAALKQRVADLERRVA